MTRIEQIKEDLQNLIQIRFDPRHLRHPRLSFVYRRTSTLAEAATIPSNSALAYYLQWLITVQTLISLTFPPNTYWARRLPPHWHKRPLISFTGTFFLVKAVQGGYQENI